MKSLSALGLIPTMLACAGFLISCGKGESTTSPSTRLTQATVLSIPLAEYAAGQAVAIHIKGLDSYVTHGLGGKVFLMSLIEAGFPRVLIVDDAAPSELQSTRAFLADLPAVLGTHAGKIRVWKSASTPGGGRFIRDWMPLVTLQGMNHGFMDFKYFQNGDETASALVNSLKLPVQESTKTFEGGNFTADSKGTCFLGEGGASETRPAKQTKVHEDLEKFGCRKTIYLPGMHRKDGEGTFVGTNHIDMWMKLVADDLAFVTEIDAEQLADYRKDPERYLRALSNNGIVNPRTRELIDKTLAGFAQRLDEGAAVLRAAGVRVVRVPHPLPLSGYTPLINGVQSGKHILLSSLPGKASNGGSIDKALYESVLARARAVIEKEGYTTSFLDASPLVGGSGALHCATSSLPVVLVDSLTSASKPPAPPVQSGQFCRIASSDGSMNLRAEPQASGRLIASVPNGTGFVRVGISGNWSRIEIRLDGILQGNSASLEKEIYVNSSGITCP